METEETTITEQEIEMASLRSMIDGFNTQSMGMPSITLRFLELEGMFKKEEAEDAIKLCGELFEKIKGNNITVSQLAIYYVIAELNLQKQLFMNKDIQVIKNAKKQSDVSYV